MANLGFAISGSQASSLRPALRLSTTNGATLNAGSSCTVQVIFTRDNGRERASLVSLFVCRGDPGDCAAEWNGTDQSGLNVNPAQLSFGLSASAIKRRANGESHEYQHVCATG